ncbi:spermatogenesis-associated protein 13 [Gonapodya sp. JEL0774]|nr:spermatogenesis-associated protein 13 [Gonapodya sp. JEL0774]
MAYLNGESSNTELKFFIEYCSFRQETRNLTIGAFLLKPVQRICKYPLLLKELLKHTAESHPDYAGVKGALDAIMRVVDVVNERRHIVENSIKTLKILGQLEYTEKQKLAYEVSRRHLLDATLSKLHYNPDTSPTGIVSRKGNARYVVVFSDCVIIAVPSQGWLVGGHGKAKVKAVYPIKDVLATEVVATADDGNVALRASGAFVGNLFNAILGLLGSFVFELRTLRNNEEKTMYFSTPSKAERHRWMKGINNARIEALEGIESRNIAGGRRQSAAVTESIESISSNEDIHTDNLSVMPVPRGVGVLRSAGSAMFLSLVTGDDAPTPVSAANEEFEDAIVADTLRSVAVTHVQLVDGGSELPPHQGEQCIIEEAFSQELAQVEEVNELEGNEGGTAPTLDVAISTTPFTVGVPSMESPSKRSSAGSPVGHSASPSSQVSSNRDSQGFAQRVSPKPGSVRSSIIEVEGSQAESGGRQASEGNAAKPSKQPPPRPAVGSKIAALQANIAPAINRSFPGRQTPFATTANRPTATVEQPAPVKQATPSVAPVDAARPPKQSPNSRPPSTVLATSIAAVKLRPVSSRPTSLLPGQLDLGTNIIDKSKWLTGKTGDPLGPNASESQDGHKSVTLIVDQFEQWRAKRPVATTGTGSVGTGKVSTETLG